MEFVRHPLIKPNTIQLRDYQINIAKTALEKNTLVCIPTGIGKTICAILVAAGRLQKFPGSRVLVLAPTKPLCVQHQKAFERFMLVDSALITGELKPSARVTLYESAAVIVATPQTVQNDLESWLRLDNFSLLVVDECHRSVKKYAYPFVARSYLIQAKNPRTLGLTASPGAEKVKIDEIRANLAIQAVELRDESSQDVQPYVQETRLEVVRIPLPEKFKKIQRSLLDALHRRIKTLQSLELIRGSPTKTALLHLQRELIKKQKSGFIFAALSAVAQAIRIEHALELLETQGISPLHRYLADLQRRARSEKKRSLSAIVNDKDIRSAADLVADLHSRGIEHPKLDRLKTILVHHFKNNKKTNVMVFAHFRTSIARIVQELAKIPYVKPVHFIGQANKPGGKGLRQKEQLDILRKFRSLTFNTLVCSSVGEEGLDIPEVDLVIFYDAVPSEIRTIQRRGRTGRRRPGRVIMLVTKGTKDEGYYWAARHKEKKMRRILSDMHGPRQQSLTEFK